MSEYFPKWVTQLFRLSNTDSANRFSFVKHEETLNTAQVCTLGAKLCGFVCIDRAQHSIEHHNKADIASCIGSIIIMRSKQRHDLQNCEQYDLIKDSLKLNPKYALLKHDSY